MPLFYQQHINQNTRLAIWKIEESEEFFSSSVPLQTKITHPHKRLQHFAGRYLLRFLFPDFPHESILIADTKKPFLENETYHFSISHCGDYAAAIVSKNFHVGIDIEIPVEKILKIQHKFINEKEALFLKQEDLLTNIEKLTLIWSTKETLFKWYGLGNVDFKRMLNVDISNAESLQIISAEIRHNSLNKKLQIHLKHFNKLILTYTFTSV
ncbi:MAG: 4'-phosphopantetheinyl transferase superfamily protein [Chitinophagaceae bacterium]|nr:4'-phosphopantetheinyl transferase superfamily protein [Chitinophagaceae bacterium]